MENEFIIELQAALDQQSSFDQILRDIKLIQKRLENVSAGKIKLSAEINDKFKRSLQDLAKTSGASMGKDLGAELANNLINTFNVKAKAAQKEIKSLSSSLYRMNVKELKTGVEDPAFIDTLDKLGQAVQKNANIIQQKMGIYDDFYGYFQNLGKIKIPDVVKSELGKDWNAMRLTSASKFVTNMDGIELDSIYQEMVGRFKDIFSGTTDQTQQFREIVDAVRAYRADVDKFTPLDPSAMDSVWDDLVTNVGTMSLKIRAELDMLPEVFDDTGANIKTSLLNIDKSFENTDIDKLSDDIKGYFQSIANIEEKDVKLKFFKNMSEDITSFTATLQKGQGIIEKYDFALDDLGKFSYSGGNVIDKSGPELEKVTAKAAEYGQRLEALKRTYQTFLSGTSATNPFKASVESIDFSNVTDKASLDTMLDKLRQAEAQARALNASVDKEWSSTGAKKMVQDLVSMGSQIDILEAKFKGADFQIPENVEQSFESVRDILSDIDMIDDPQKKIESYNQLKSTLKDLKDQYLLLSKQQKNINTSDNLLSKKQKLGNDIISWMVSNQKASRAFDDVLVQIIKDMDKITKGADLDKLSKQFRAVKAEAEAMDKTSGGFLQDMKEQMADALTNTLKYSASIGIINRAKQSIKEMLAEVEALQGSLIEFNKVADLSQEELERFSRQAFEVGDKVAKTGKDIIDGMSEFRRAGYDTSELLGMSEAANIMTNVADGITEVSDAASSLIAIMRGYDIDTSNIMSILDVLNEVSNNSPVGFDNLADGLERTAGTLSQTGTTLAENVGLLTGGFAQLRNMEKVSTGLITISQRLRGVGEDGEAIDGLSAKLQDDFEKIGIAIEDADGSLRSTYDIINDYAKVFPTLSDKQKQYFGELAAGKPQVKVWNAIVQQIDDVNNAIDQAGASMGSAAKENEIYMDSIAGAKNAFSNAMAGLSGEVIDDTWVTDFIEAGTSLLKMLTNIISTDTVVRDAIGGIADTVKDLAGLLEDLSDNKFIAGLAQAFITLKTVQMGADIVQMATGAKEASGMFSSLMGIVKGYTKTQGAANTVIDTAVSATEAMTGSISENREGILSCVTAIGKYIAANPLAAAGIAAGTVALVAGGKAIDDYIHRVENAKEALSESRDNFDNVNSTIKSLSDELKTNRDRIAELKAMGTLTYVEQSELENLQAATRELERQYDIETKKKASAARELFEDNVVAFEAEFTPGDISQTYVDILKGQDIAIDTLMAQKGVEPLLAALSKVREAKEDAFTEGNDALIDDLTATEKECKARLEDQLFTLEKYRINMQDILADRDFTAEEQQFYDRLQNGIRMIYGEIDPNKWNSMAIDQVFDTKGIEHTKEEFIELAKAGKLDGAIADCKVLNKALSEAGLILQEGQTAAEAFKQEMYALSRAGEDFTDGFNDGASQISYAETIKQLDTMSASLDALNGAYGHFKDGKKISFDDLSSLMEQFKDVSGVEGYVKAIQDAKGDIQGTQAAFDDLLSAYLQQSDILRQVTDENKDLIVSYLEEKGVANAASIAENALAANKKIASIETRGLTDAVIDELVGLADEKGALDEVTAQIYSYALEKSNANNVALSTEGDIQNIMALVSACGSGITALQALANAKNGIFSSIATGSPKKGDTYGGMSGGEALALTSVNRTGRLPVVGSSSFDDFKTGVQKQQAYVEDVTRAAQEEIDAVFAKLKGTTQATSNGGAGNAGKSGGGSGSKAKETAKDQIDWIEILIKRADEKVEKLQKRATDAKGWQAKNTLQDTIYDELQAKLTGLQQQHDRYMQEANAVGLSDIYINKIQNGELDIETISDDDVINGTSGKAIKQMIQDYQKW